MKDDREQRLVTLLADMREEEALHLAKEMIGSGHDPLRVLECCRDAMSIVGERYEAQEYFLTELMLAGEMLTEISAMAKPLVVANEGGANQSRATIVLGTVHGDLHDIGKNLVSTMLKGVGFDIVDLGINVSADEFVQQVTLQKPHIVAISALLTTTMPQMKNIIDALKKVQLRSSVKVMVGGAPVNDKFAVDIGADGYAQDAGEAVDLARKLLAN